MSPTIQPKAGSSGGKEDVITLYRNAQRAIGVIALLLPFIYAYLSFKDVPLQDILKSLSSQSAASILWKIVLAIYFFAWVFGTRTDAEDQEIVYRHVPEGGQFPRGSIGVLAGIFVLAAILLWSPSFEFFVGALTMFFAFNVFAWRYLVKEVVTPSVNASHASTWAEGHYIDSERIRVVSDYLRGPWQWYRFGLGAFVIAGLWGLVIAKYMNFVVPGIPDPVSWQLAQVLGMLVFVLAMEIWIWSKRLQTKLALDFLKDLGQRYTISPKTGQAPRD